MMQQFNNITPKEGRIMIIVDGVPLLSNRDILDAMVFDVVKKEMNNDEKTT